MDSSAGELILADSYLREWLSGLGLAVEYIQAEGDTLYFLDESGQKVPVLDYVGGFGSLIFGHNHPEIVARAKEILDARTPVHTQMAQHSHTNQLATALNKIFQRELRTDEPYFALFANSGAEGIEVAMKHAELDRRMRITKLTDDVNAHLDHARAVLKDGTAAVADSAYEILGVTDRTPEALLAGIEHRNLEQLARPPLFLTLEGSFHGKLVGSIQLTHNERFRTPFTALSSQARFLPVDQPDVLKKIVDDERVTLFDVVLDDGALKVVERDFPIIGAFFVEPIRGEAGIRPLTSDFAREIEQVCTEIGCPIVVDEIQSGMGRSGAFLASSHIGLRGDYFVLAKSLGGGIAKAAVMLVRQARYQKEFEVIHSSTFAKDAFSCHIALKVLEMLEADNGAAYRLTAERGTRLATMLASVQADFPDVITDVRGKGLMIGLEFTDQSYATCEIIRTEARNGLLGYVITGYLLREHRIRAFPTASAGNTLRFEPSIYLTDTEIDHSESALKTVCTILRNQDGQRLINT